MGWYNYQQELRSDYYSTYYGTSIRMIVAKPFTGYGLLPFSQTNHDETLMDSCYVVCLCQCRQRPTVSQAGKYKLLSSSLFWALC